MKQEKKEYLKGKYHIKRMPEFSRKYVLAAILSIVALISIVCYVLFDLGDLLLMVVRSIWR